MTDEHPMAETDQDATIQERFAAVTAAVTERLARNLGVRRNLPGEGRVRIDRQLPFVCLYRDPPERPDAGTRRLVTAAAAYLFCSGDECYHAGLSGLCTAISETMREHFGVFLLLEIWTSPAEEAAPTGGGPRPPEFRIITPDQESLPATIDAFEEALSGITIGGLPASVVVERRPRVAPPGRPPLTPGCHTSGGCFTIGLEVAPIYRDPQTGALFPVVLQRLRRAVAVALRQAIFAFTGVGADQPRLHFDSLGPSTLVKAVNQVDAQLCEVSTRFDFLRQVTPVNSDAAWEAFQQSGGEQEPDFEYRPLPFDFGLLKRQLFDIELERVEDVTMAHLFYQKQEELDRQLTAMHDIGTESFLYSSLQLYGEAEDELVAAALEILETIPPPESGAAAHDGYADVADIVAQAEQEIAFYRNRLPDFDCRVEVCDDIASGIMVSQDRLYVSSTVRVGRERVLPLLHHEIGTHLLTYVNGRAQPIRLLFAGLAGYEALQEGLAVMAEYLVGGLTAKRLRALAGRVMAVQALCEGATFVDTYRRLHGEYGLSPRSAFTTTLRVFRAGGLTKDAIYLRGLRDLLRYLCDGHEIEPLYVGKLALEQIPFIQELRRRGILHPPALLPRFWQQDTHLHQRLKECSGSDVLALLETDQ